MAYTFDSF